MEFSGQSFEPRPWEEKAHRGQFGEKTYDVWKLVRYAEQFPTQLFSLSSGENRAVVDGLLSGTYWTDARGIGIGPSDIVNAYASCEGSFDLMQQRFPELHEHIEKIRQVDLTFPVLVYQGQVIDGMHRFTKAMLLGNPTIPMKILTDLPADAEVQ